MNSSLMWLLIPGVLLAGTGLGAGLLLHVVAPNVEPGPDAPERAAAILTTADRVCRLLRLAVLIVASAGWFIASEALAATATPQDLTIAPAVLLMLGAAAIPIVADAVVTTGAVRRASWLVPAGQTPPMPAHRGWAVLHASIAVAIYVAAAAAGSDLTRTLVLTAALMGLVLSVGAYGIATAVGYLAHRFPNGPLGTVPDRARGNYDLGWDVVVKAVGAAGLAAWLVPAIPNTIVLLGREVTTAGLGFAIGQVAVVITVIAGATVSLAGLANWGCRRQSTRGQRHGHGPALNSSLGQ